MLNKLLDDHVPNRTTSSRFQLPWNNTELNRLQRKKARAHKKAKSTKAIADWKRFKNLQKEMQFEARRARTNYITSLFGAANPKSFWTYIKGLRSERTGVAPLRDTEKGVSKSDPMTQAKMLNEQFASVFTIEKTEVPNLGPSPHQSMDDIHVEAAGVAKLLHELKPEKAAGPDGVSTRLLKETANEIAPVLAFIFNTTLKLGEVPKDWKKANVAPIYKKKGHKWDCENYRPISLTCVCCKIMEHIVFTNIMTHFEQFKILNPSQHGFRKSVSCISQLVEMSADLNEALDKGLQVDCILLDFSKAFDKVAHRRLLHKIAYYGVRGSTLSWITAFLAGRSQQVLVDGKTSSSLPVTSGVPQGSVLGPLLFLAYINDLPDGIVSSVRLFADDTVLYRVVNSIADCVALQADLDRLLEWEKKWLMEFNPSKCEILRITRKTVHYITHPYNIRGHVLEPGKDSKGIPTGWSKYLGVRIDPKLTWTPHIKETVKKARTSLNFLQRNTRGCPSSLKTRCYQTFVRPQLEYAAAVWNPHCAKQVDLLEAIQRRAARYVTGNFARRASVTEMLQQLKWDTLERRRQDAMLVILYKITHSIMRIPYLQYIQLSPRVGLRGPTLHFIQPRCRLVATAGSFFPVAVKLWNALPRDVGDASSLETFKSRLVDGRHP